MDTVLKVTRTIVIVWLSTPTLFGGLISSTPSMKEFEKGAEKLTVYTDVPGHEKSIINGHPSRAKSDIYEIRVRSAATDNKWVQCFAHMTHNRALEMPEVGENRTPTSRHAYQLATKGWTHTYANFEMSQNSPVEVEIRKIGQTLLNGSAAIVKSAVHPSQKFIAGSKKDENGCVYFKINKPGQIVIDINGQMDDHNAAFPSGTAGGAMKGNPPVHSVALYANPIMEKPAAQGVGIRFVKAGVAPPTDSNYTTMVFGPGVHRMIDGLKLFPGKSYHIPGDAILYGSLSNRGVDKGALRCSGDSINVYGYGTICGIQIPHYQNRKNNTEYPEWNALREKSASDVGLTIINAWDVKINGITIADPANFNTKIDGQHKRVNDQSLMSWVKLHSWRVNGDGCGGYLPIENSFFRTSDDSTYVRDWRRRCTFWKDTNANIFRFVNHIAGGLDDCDILYSRWRDPKGVGSVFEFASKGDAKPKVIQIDITIKNLRFHDKISNPRRLVSLSSVDTYLGMTFEHIAFYLPLNKTFSSVNGSAEAPYKGKTIFKNITFQNGLDGSRPVKLTQANYKGFFETNEFVNQCIFEN